MAWLGGGWPPLRRPPPKLTRVPAVFVMVTVMSRVPLLMRTPSPWMMGLMGHLCTGVPLCAGWNCQIPPVLSWGITQLISCAAERRGWESIFINVVYPFTSVRGIRNVLKVWLLSAALFTPTEKVPNIRCSSKKVHWMLIWYLAFSASNPLDPSNPFFFPGLKSG